MRQRRPLDLELAQSLAHLARRQRTIGGEIEQPLFFHIQSSQLLLDPRMGLALDAEPLLEAGAHLLAHRGDLVRCQLQALDGAEKRILHQGDGQMWQVACVILSAHAQIVGVDSAMPIDGLRVDELPVAPPCMAPTAPQHRPEEMGMNDVALVGLHPHIQHALDPLEELRRDEGGVLAGKDLPLVGHHPEVVGITQDGREFAARDRLLVPSGCAPRRQPLLGKFFMEASEAVLTGGVLREGPSNERCALGINVDAVDEVAVDVFPNIEVPQGCTSSGAPVLGFVEHLVADVLAALPDLDLVHDVGDGFHGVSHVALAKLFLGRDQLDVHAGQDALSDGGIGLVAEHP